MPYIQDTEIDLKAQVGCNYIISSHHRRTGSPHKSIWIITHEEEVDCFINAIKDDWKYETEAWGIKIEEEELQVVGVTPTNKELKLAKFVDGSKTDVWHGYPADYMSNAQDRPKTQILKVWVDNRYLTKSKMNKIRRGLSCNL